MSKGDKLLAAMHLNHHFVLSKGTSWTVKDTHLCEPLDKVLDVHKDVCGCSRWDGRVIATTCHHCKGKGCDKCHEPGILYDFESNVFWIAEDGECAYSSPEESVDDWDEPKRAIGSKVFEYRRKQITPKDMPNLFADPDSILEELGEEFGDLGDCGWHERHAEKIEKAQAELQDFLATAISSKLTAWQGEQTGGVYTITESDIKHRHRNNKQPCEKGTGLCLS